MGVGTAVQKVSVGRKFLRKLVAAKTQSEEVESELVSRAAGGDKEAYRLLVEKYQRRLFTLAFEIVRSREDAEDIVQESFVKAFLSLPEFRNQSGFFTWVYRIAYNLAIDFKRRTSRRGGETVEYDERTHVGGVFDQMAGQIDAPDQALLRRQQGQKIEFALQEISPEHRAVIVLREIDGLAYEEIADTLQISKGTVMSRLHYARKRLQRALDEFAPNEFTAPEFSGGDVTSNDLR